MDKTRFTLIVLQPYLENERTESQNYVVIQVKFMMCIFAGLVNALLISHLTFSFVFIEQGEA